MICGKMEKGTDKEFESLELCRVVKEANLFFPVTK